MSTYAISIDQTLAPHTIKTNADAISNKQRWAARVVGGVPALFLLVDGGMKLFKPAVVVQSTLELGYPDSAIIGMGVVLLVSTVLYLIPRTAILGAILLTGYLGGAVATQIRVSAPMFNLLFPVIFGTVLWVSLWLRDARIRELLPLNARSASQAAKLRMITNVE
jgi:hypothetical protein